MSERGVFGVDRGIWDHPIFKERKPFSRREAWLWMLSEAAFKPRRVRHAGQTFTIGRGQLAHSIRFMAEAWRWEKTKVERFFDDLKTETMIATDAEIGITVTTICNYDKYQVVGLPDATAAATQDETGPRQDRDSSATNKKKEIIKERLDDDGGERARAFDVATELAKVCGFPTPDHWPPGWCGAPMWVQKCLNEGWDPEVMLAETRAVCGRKRDGPPDNFIYLEKPLARAHARHMAPLPKVELLPQETINGARPNSPDRSKSALDAVREVRRRLVDDANRNAPLRISEG